MMTATQIKSAYARVLKEPVIVRRYTGTGTSRPRFDAQVRGKATQYAADELIATIQQGDQKVIVLADDLVAKQFPLPVISSDKIVVQGRELAIINPSQRKAPDGTIIAYEIQVRG